MRGSHGDDRRGFLTFLDNVLTVDESAGGEENAWWHHTNPGGLLEEVRGEYEKSSAAEFAKALQQ